MHYQFSQIGRVTDARMWTTNCINIRTFQRVSKLSLAFAIFLLYRKKSRMKINRNWISNRKDVFILIKMKFCHYWNIFWTVFVFTILPSTNTYIKHHPNINPSLEMRWNVDGSSLALDPEKVFEIPVRPWTKCCIGSVISST